jgi:competence protein ComEC
MLLSPIIPRAMRLPPLPRRHMIPALRLAIPYAAGIAAGDLLSMPRVVAGAGALLLLVATGLLLRDPRRSALPLAAAPFLLLFSLGAFKLDCDRAGDPLLADSVSFVPSSVRGMIVDPVVTSGRRVRFTLRSEEYLQEGRVFPFHALVAVNFLLKRSDTLLFRADYGAALVMTGVLSPPTPERNPGEFSLRQYYDASGVTATLFVRGITNVVVMDTSGGNPLIALCVVPARRWILRLIDSTVGGEEGEFLKGLLIGDRSGIPPETNQAFVDSGVAHVLAVSGSNVAVVAMILVFLYDLFRLPWRWRALPLACALVWYMLITGSQPPVVRATIMALVLLAGGVLQRRTNGYNALGVAALVILLYDARQLFDIGFQLSFGAVFSILHVYPRMNALIRLMPHRRWWERGCVLTLQLCAVSLAATIGTLPLTALAFGKFSVIGILANLPVIPATSLSVILGAAGIVTGLVSDRAAEAYGAANHLVLYATIAVAKISASAPFAFIETYRFSWRHAVAFYLCLAIVVHWPEKNIVRASLLLLLASANCFCFADLISPAPARGDLLRFHCIDVGQGDALFVEFPGGRTMLIDGGPATGAYDAGAKTVSPYLRRRGITRIDLLLVSHPHDDHLGGVMYLLRHFDVGRVIDAGFPVRSGIYDAYRLAAPGREVDSAGCVLGSIPSARVYVLGPAREFARPDSTHPKEEVNNSSLVLKIVYGSTSFLLVGDAGERAEGSMVERYGNFLKSDMLKAGHHGSITASSARFLAEVRPSTVVISVGRNNTFGHPSPRVVDRYTSLGARVIRTDREGGVILASDGEKISREEWRER